MEATVPQAAAFFMSGGNLATSNFHRGDTCDRGGGIETGTIMLWRRRILLPWLLSAVVMYGLSFAWHGLALTDLQELRIPLALYLCLSGVVYLLIGLGLTVAVHQCVAHEWISLRKAFPLMSMLLGAAIGFVVYLVVFILGMSFASKGFVHIVVDILWQMLEQGLGGLMVSLGLIYDMHRHFLESERAN